MTQPPPGPYGRPQPGPGYNPYMRPPPPVRDNWMAATSMFLAIASGFCILLICAMFLSPDPTIFGVAFLPAGAFIFMNPLAVIFGCIALREINVTGERGRGQAIWGAVLSCVWFVLAVLLVMLTS